MDYVLVSSIAYIVGLIGWLILWNYIPGYRWLKREKLMYIPFILCLVTFLINLYLVSIAQIPIYGGEITILEGNAKAIAGFSLGITAFVILTFKAKMNILEMKEAEVFLKLIFVSFLFIVLGVLPLYWGPQTDEYLGMLRHLKMVPYLYSVYLFASGIMVFLHILNRGLNVGADKGGFEKNATKKVEGRLFTSAIRSVND